MEIPRTYLHDVVDLDALDSMLAGGYVRVGECPTSPLRIYNYTAKAQYQRVWNQVTTRCRGLIVNLDNVVIARPFEKFFNHFELDPLPTGPVHVTDKLDGSLGILYYDGTAPAVATRGSFTSNQATHATRLLRERYGTFFPHPNWTYLVEIVYPGNRIVVDYGTDDDLVLIGAVDIATGRSIPLDDAAATWPGPVVESFAYGSLHEALATPERTGAEGFVVHFTDCDTRVKVKYPSYVTLHQIVTNLSTISVFDHLRSGAPLDDLLAVVPDELHAAVIAVAETLTSQFNELVETAAAQYATISRDHDPAVDRRSFAIAVCALPNAERGALFALADRGAINPQTIWDRIRPAHQLLSIPR